MNMTFFTEAGSETADPPGGLNRSTEVVVSIAVERIYISAASL